MATQAKEDPGFSIINVINGGFCIGCGACAAHKDSPFQIVMSPLGLYTAESQTNHNMAPEVLQNLSRVCPFSSASPNETEIAQQAYPENSFHPAIGYYKSLYAGHVVEGSFREKGSSGGFGGWCQVELMRRDLVDYVINVAATGEQTPLFRYTVCKTPEDVLRGSSSKYYPVEMSEILFFISENPGRYAVVGIPCFIKAVRLLCLQNPTLRERIAYTIGLVCGHLKSERFAELLAWQIGAPPGTLKSFNFRKKISNRRASDYGVEATWLQGEKLMQSESPTAQLLGGNWGHGFFKYKACDYCDDVFAETADIVIGDAWLQRYTADSRGTSVVITRAAAFDEILEEAVHQRRISVERISEEDMIQSQAGGLRHKRQNLQYRLWLDESQGNWHPPKRVEARADILTATEQAKQRARIKLREESHRIYDQYRLSRNLRNCISRLKALTREHDRIGSPLWRRCLRRIKSACIRIISLLSSK
jgi:coenzyme F420-reducing hydrogenase beta subunit